MLLSSLSNCLSEFVRSFLQSLSLAPLFSFTHQSCNPWLTATILRTEWLQGVPRNRKTHSPPWQVSGDFDWSAINIHYSFKHFFLSFPFASLSLRQEERNICALPEQKTNPLHLYGRRQIHRPTDRAMNEHDLKKTKHSFSLFATSCKHP